MAKSVTSNRGGKQQPLRRETTSDNELEIPRRRRHLTSDADEFVNRSGYYTASDAEPKNSTMGFPPHHIVIEPPRSPEQIEYETIYPTADNLLDSKTASDNHTSEIDMDEGHTNSTAKRDSPLSPMPYSPKPLLDEGEEADDEAQDEITSDVPMSPEIPPDFTENTSQFVKMETAELPANDRYPLNSSAQEVVVIESDDRGEGELIEISDDDDPRPPHDELDPRSLHKEWETSLIGDDGRSETSYHSGESCFFSIFC